MKLEIYKAVNDYYLRIGGAIDYKIAEILNIPIEEYNQILIDNGAHRILYLNDEIDIGYEFRKRSDAEAAIKTLEPYLIMIKLTE